MSSLEGAESWTEVLEREAVRTAIEGYEVNPEGGQRYGVYVYVIVTNITTFSGDYLVANPGSRSMGVSAASKDPSMHYWNSGTYTQSDYAIDEFVRCVHRNGIGESPVKANFFPQGTKLTKEILDFPPRYIDGLIAKRGKTETEDETPNGDDMAGGILRSASTHSENTVAFNKRTKYCPVFLLAYKRRPGESFNGLATRTLRYISEELKRQKREEEQQQAESSGAGATDHGPKPSFW